MDPGPGNRSTILACALELFASRGYEAVGVQEIVDAAGITKPTLYHYFGSKRGLLDSLLEQQFAALFHILTEAGTYERDLPQTVQRIARAYLAFATGHRAFYRLALAAWFAPPDGEAFRAVAPYNERQQALLEDLFVRAASDHGNMRGRQRAYAATLLGMVNTYAGLVLNGYAEADDALVRQAVHQFLHGVFS